MLATRRFALLVKRLHSETGRSIVKALVGECSLISDHLVQSFLFGVRTPFPHLFSALHPCSPQWCRRRGAQKLWFVENPWKSSQSMKMFAKYLKFWANYLKIRIKMAPNVVWFWKIAPCHRTWGESREDLTMEVIPKIICVGGNTQRVACKLFGQVWGNSGKNLSHSRKFACSCNCASLPPAKLRHCHQR